MYCVQLQKQIVSLGIAFDYLAVVGYDVILQKSRALKSVTEKKWDTHDACKHGYSGYRRFQSLKILK